MILFLEVPIQSHFMKIFGEGLMPKCCFVPSPKMVQLYYDPSKFIGFITVDF